jgi:hypothetical protein
MLAAHYTVDDEIFTNKFQAIVKSKKVNSPVKFKLFDSAFDTVSWAEPSETWDQLLDRRAHQIVAKGRPIVLDFSGGSDSYTMYQVFKRNNIKLYAIHLRLKEKSTDNFQAAIDFLNKEKPDCKIFILYDSVDVLNNFYNSPEWVWKLSKINFSISLAQAMNLEDHPDITDLPSNYIQVVGLEKPRFKIFGDKIYSFQPDTLYEYVTTRYTRLEYFFINSNLPELHVKQCHMLAKFIRGKAALENKPLAHYADIHNPEKHSYNEYCTWSGRFGDLVNSASQKMANVNSTLVIPNFDVSKIKYTGRTETMFTHGFINGNQFMKNYVDGLLYVRQDSALRDVFGDAEDYYSVRAIDSKLYEII